MSDKIINGKVVADKIAENLKNEVDQLHQKTGLRPTLLVIQIGDRPDSTSYILRKKEASTQTGFNFIHSKHPETTTEAEVLSLVKKFNEDESVNGILVQLPLPSHIDSKKVIQSIDKTKDVDGLHESNIGALALKDGTPSFVSCTPLGCLRLLEYHNVPIAGKHAVIFGRSNIVGLPASLLLLKKDATVTICHSRTKNPWEITRLADILIVAVGQPRFVKADWIKPGAVVIDVGIHRIANPARKSGFQLVGDVDFDEAKEVAGLISQVPNGVGPMTVISLVENTITAFKRTHNIN